MTRRPRLPRVATAPLCLPPLLLAALVLACNRPPPPGTAPGHPPRLVVRGERPVAAARPDVPHVEPHLVAHPDDPDHLVGAAFVLLGERWEMDVYVSRDGGNRWVRRSLPGLEDAYRVFDPWLAWAPDGDLYLVAIETTRPPGTGGEWRLLLHRSRDGGMSWSEGLEVPGRTLDHPVLLAGEAAGEQGLWIVASEAVAPSAIAVVAAPGGRGSGDPFSPRGRFVPPRSADILGGAALSGGSLVFTFTDRSGLRDARAYPLWVVSSRDGGRSFEAPVRLGDAVFYGAPQVVADPSHPGRLYTAWVDRHGDGTAVLVARSDDAGSHWAAPVRVDAPQAPGVLRMRPVVAVDPVGTLAVSWHDRRRDPEGACGDVLLAASVDHGESFLEPVRVSEALSCPGAPGNRTVAAPPFAARWPGGGDYSGITARGPGRFQLLWSDSRHGVAQPWTATVEVAPRPRHPVRGVGRGGAASSQASP